MLSSAQEYLHRLKTALANSPIIREWSVVNEQIWCDRGHLRVRCWLITGDFLEASEFFVALPTGIEQQRYRYQWMDATQTQLKRRWDNAPHFPDVSTFPHHVHVDQEDQVLPSAMMGIAELIQVLEQLLMQ